MASNIRPAATVLIATSGAYAQGLSAARSLLSHSHSVTSPIKAKGQDYRLLMVKRSSKNRFMPSTHVFPGGVAEVADGDNKWAQLCGWKGDNTEMSFRIAAIREVFEETNILLSSSVNHVSVNEMKDWRVKVHKDATLFYDMCKQFNVKLDLNSLHPYAHWITPEVEKYRYDTKFYIAALPDQYTPESLHQATEDAGEVSGMEWFTPDEAVAAFKEGTINLPPPTWITLRLLSRIPHLKDLLAQYSARPFYSTSTPISKETILPYLPMVVSKSEQGLVMALPGDSSYPVPELAGATDSKHRMTLKEGGNFEYVYSDQGISTMHSKL